MPILPSQLLILLYIEPVFRCCSPKRVFLRHRCFLMNSGKFLMTSFYKEPLWRLLQHIHSLCLLSHQDLSYFQRRCLTYFLAEHFLGLICRLGTRVSSIFQALSQKPFSTQLNICDRPFFAKIVSSLIKTVKYFWKKKKLHCDVR